MKSLHCLGFLFVALLSACDADKAPAPPAKAATQATVTVDAPASKVADAAPAQAAAPEPAAPVVTAPVISRDKPADVANVHTLKPNLPVVPVVATTNPDPVTTAGNKNSDAKPAANADKASVANAKSAKVKAENAQVASRAPVASKSKAASKVVKETRLPKATLDLSLPPDMVKQLTPPSNVITANARSKSPSPGAKPLLPKMFQESDADSDFQLQGRLLSNEMQLQLRNEARRDVEGAALDFKFKQ